MKVRIASVLVMVLLSVSLSVLGFAQAPKKHKVSPTKAAKIALKKVPGKLRGAPKLEHEDGKWQYEVMVTTSKGLKEVNVNADSGKVVSIEGTSPAEEEREAKAEKKGKG